MQRFYFFPIRGITLHDGDRCGLSSLASERFDYVAKEMWGYCFDVGCGKRIRFMNSIVTETARGLFDSVAFIANLNHAFWINRDRELAEAHRVLKPGGNIIVTMENS